MTKSTITISGELSLAIDDAAEKARDRQTAICGLIEAGVWATLFRAAAETDDRDGDTNRRHTVKYDRDRHGFIGGAAEALSKTAAAGRPALRDLIKRGAIHADDYRRFRAETGFGYWGFMDTALISKTNEPWLDRASAYAQKAGTWRGMNWLARRDFVLYEDAMAYQMTGEPNTALSEKTWRKLWAQRPETTAPQLPRV